MAHTHIDLGFTGTQEGMTGSQRKVVAQLLTQFTPVMARHGDCIGADTDFHELVTEIRGRICRIKTYPPIDTTLRAYCKADEEHEPLPYLIRDDLIARDCQVLLATPKGFKEQRRSGTWATIRYGYKHGKEVIIVYPDGSISHYQGPHS
jgi:hypothetical protein